MKKLIFLLILFSACGDDVTTEEITQIEQIITTGNSSGFSVKDFGATGDGATDDTQAFQDAINAAIKVGGGEVIIPTPGKFYNIKNTINIAPATGSVCYVNINGFGIRNSQILYTGPSNKAVFKVLGLKSSVISGVKVWIQPGISGVVVWDIDTTPQAESTNLVTFKNCSSLLGNGVNNVGWRLGHISGGGADISSYQWENCAADGNQGEGSVVSGQIGWLLEGRNTLQNTWFGGFGAFLDKVYSNLSQKGTGATYENGNGSVFFYGLGGSHNNVDFEIAAEQVYYISGGRWEVGKKFLVVPEGVEDPVITVSGVEVNDYDPADGNLIHMGRPGTLTLDGCRMYGKGGGNFTNMITLGGDRSMGKLLVRGGSYASPKPFYKIIKGTWQINIQSVGQLEGPYTTGYFSNEPPN
jgi:Pectate lyase superfamily protein